MDYVVIFMAINWGVPFLFLLYPLVMWLVFKDFVFDGFCGPFMRFKLADENLEPWHAKAWRGWGGVGLHSFMCYRDDRHVKHEGTHCYQQLPLGLVWWLIYFGHMLWILITQKIKGKPYTKHPYLDCVWERHARKVAGQTVDIPPERWPQGKDDLIPWL